MLPSPDCHLRSTLDRSWIAPPLIWWFLIDAISLGLIVLYGLEPYGWSVGNWSSPMPFLMHGFVLAYPFLVWRAFASESREAPPRPLSQKLFMTFSLLGTLIWWGMWFLLDAVLLMLILTAEGLD